MHYCLLLVFLFEKACLADKECAEADTTERSGGGEVSMEEPPATRPAPSVEVRSWG